MHVGDFEIHALPEGQFWVGGDKDFTPAVAGQPKPKGTLHIAVNPFVVRTPSDVLVLDPGLGSYAPTHGVDRLLEQLQAVGVAREAVTKVLLSHLHLDHAGGCLYRVQDTWHPTFPNADYVVQRGEASAPYSESSAPVRDLVLEVLDREGQLVTVEGSGALTAEIEYEHTGGHTRDHQLFRLFSGDGRIVVFGGDVLPEPSQILRRFVAKYDHDGAQAQAVRTRLVQEAAAGGHLLLLYHSTEAPAAYVRTGPNGSLAVEGVTL